MSQTTTLSGRNQSPVLAPVGPVASRQLAGWVLAVLLTLVSGCFTGEYDRRMKETMQQVASQVLFTQASPIADATGKQTGASIHMPLFVDSTAKALAAGADSQPPFVQLPGFAYAYEIQIKQQPAYVYFAAVPTSKQSAADLQKQVRDAIAKKFSSASWQDVSVKKSDGSTATVKRLTVTGPQKFGSQERPGRFDLYLCETPKYHLLIGWRAPSDVASSIKFFETGGKAVASIK